MIAKMVASNPFPVWSLISLSTRLCWHRTGAWNCLDAVKCVTASVLWFLNRILFSWADHHVITSHTVGIIGVIITPMAISMVMTSHCDFITLDMAIGQPKRLETLRWIRIFDWPGSLTYLNLAVPMKSLRYDKTWII